jgi:hypothetical protein
MIGLGYMVAMIGVVVGGEKGRHALRFAVVTMQQEQDGKNAYIHLLLMTQ